MQVRKAENGRGDISQGGEHQLFVQCQMISPKNIHASSIICTWQVIFRNVYKCAYMHEITICKKY